MAIIRNYNDIKSIITEKYIIREKEEKDSSNLKRFMLKN